MSIVTLQLLLLGRSFRVTIDMGSPSKGVFARDSRGTFRVSQDPCEEQVRGHTVEWRC